MSVGVFVEPIPSSQRATGLPKAHALLPAFRLVVVGDDCLDHKAVGPDMLSIIATHVALMRHLAEATLADCAAKLGECAEMTNGSASACRVLSYAQSTPDFLFFLFFACC